MNESIVPYQGPSFHLDVAQSLRLNESIYYSYYPRKTRGLTTRSKIASWLALEINRRDNLACSVSPFLPSLHLLDDAWKNTTTSQKGEDVRGRSRLVVPPILGRDSVKALAQISGICQGRGSTSGCLQVVSLSCEAISR